MDSDEQLENHALLSLGDEEMFPKEAEKWSSLPDRPSTIALKRSTISWLAIAIASFLIADLAAFMYISRATNNAGVVISDRPLEMRDSYIGLAELYSSGEVKPTPLDPLLNRPRVVGLVTSAHPHQTYLEDQLRWLSSTGLMTPADLHLRVTRDTHTISQFRVMDFGMESCQLALRLPPRNAAIKFDWTFPQDLDTVELQVCQLDAPQLLDLRELSWATRPACVKEMGTFAATLGTEVFLPKFPCAWGTHLAYEISCSPATPGCSIDISPGHNETLGFYMYQYQTV